MMKIADKIGKTAIVNILHMFNTIKENMNMKIEVVFRWKCLVLFILEKQRDLELIN